MIFEGGDKLESKAEALGTLAKAKALDSITRSHALAWEPENI